MPCKTALQVGSLVLVDIVLLGQSVNQTYHLRKEFFRLSLVSKQSQTLDGCTGSFLIKAISCAASRFLTDSFL